MKYDAIIVPGSHPDPKTWKFPKRIYDSLDEAANLLAQKQAPCIITSGKWVISFEHRGIRQPFRECDAMADYLISKDVPSSALLKEGESKDTISNLYYLKTQILMPHNMHHILFVAADFRIPRLHYLCQRILGTDYDVNFQSVASGLKNAAYEKRTFKIQEDFLKPMKDGDHNWLDGKFYTASIYQP